jgi:hypothetical protein
MGSWESKCTKDTVKEEITLSNKEYELAQTEKFILIKSTIIACMLYGIPALFLLILALLSEKVKSLLYENFLPFIITFIIGAIFVILYLSNYIVNYKYEVNRTSNYDTNVKCPDYWNLVYDENPSTEHNLKYKCVMNRNIISKENTFKNDTKIKLTNISQMANNSSPATKIATWTSIQNTYAIHPENYHLYRNVNDSNIRTDVPGLSPTDLSQLQDHAMYMNNYSIPTGTSTTYTPGHQSSIAQPIIYNDDGTSTKTITRPRSGESGATGSADIPLVCDQVFPLYLQEQDENYKKSNPDVTNKFTCAYAKACNVNWSDAICN